ncbi:BTB/POZ domain-containing protein 9-like protein [Dinothrombium tinctorium]|uniref:BTB/POZ domain-containing protein 9-like protein n=1 Tax=Dinothrombium tinctorium TaxID=1965070 RepID=A0A443QI74_9ACAR|nr:BTB/POZ domain-containing protein 9-like protein [Dinothrombium tinctorium]
MDFRELNLKIKNGCENLFNSPEMSDVTLEFGSPEQRVFAHKVVLAANSEYFKAMFYGDWKESDAKLVKLEDIPAKLFMLLLKACYCVEFKLDRLSYAEFLQFCELATKFGVREVEDALKKVIKKRLCIANVYQFYAASVATNLHRFQAQFEEFFEKNINEILKNEATFKTLPKEWALKILQNDDLTVKEIDVFKAARQWVQHNQLNEEEAKEIMKCIRLEFIDWQDAVKYIRPTKVFTDMEILDALTMRSNHRLNSVYRRCKESREPEARRVRRYRGFEGDDFDIHMEVWGHDIEESLDAMDPWP